MQRLRSRAHPILAVLTCILAPIPQPLVTLAIRVGAPRASPYKSFLAIHRRPLHRRWRLSSHRILLHRLPRLLVSPLLILCLQ
ncbi:hypothetical protein B0H19DRAFT_1187951 [Mycena capillaripes]|nr:hypothetical protein B0H19DRAFT_1187951 [Mycena capillaripes]